MSFFFFAPAPTAIPGVPVREQHQGSMLLPLLLWAVAPPFQKENKNEDTSPKINAFFFFFFFFESY